MPNLFNKTKYFNRSEAGFSLVEMMVSVTVFLIIMSAIYGLLRIGLITRDTLNKSSETSKNARSSINAVGKDVINAGLGFSRVGGVVPDDFVSELLDTPKDTGSERDILTAIIAGNDIRESDLSKNGQKNDVIAFAFRDLSFNNGNSIVVTDAPISSILNNSIVLKTNSGECSVCNPYDLYLIESKEGKQAVVMATAIPDSSTMVLGRNDPLALNQPVVDGSNKRSILIPCLLGNTSDCFTYSAGVTAKKIYWVSFNVEADGTLVRTTYGNNTGGTASQQIQKQPLAYGVQNFQVRYLMQDGTISDDPSNKNKTPLKMNEVVQVEISITIRTDGNDAGVTNTELINVTSTFSTRNLKYDIQ
ncbi:MAG: prepilin-type N-terminal cleavage/methylation domain-containing protein [Pyrinomonadaceae bacterium]|nr:prepilin-type N-terminal cleavage/methylation domain-containing protein [Pyrinomonadaceae bacterium]